MCEKCESGLQFPLPKTQVLGKWEPYKPFQTTARMVYSSMLYGDTPNELVVADFRLWVVSRLPVLPQYKLGQTSLRSPEYQVGNTVSDDSVRAWHHDGLKPCSTSCCMFVIWSNTMPTEVRYVRDGSPLVVEANDVLLVNNAEVQHRCPAGLERVVGSRWFIRVYFNFNVYFF